MGVSFAIPMDVVMDVVSQIKSQGFVSRGWLGVVIQNVTRELAESFGLDKPQGALVSRIMPGSPAGKAGIVTGDIILRFDGKEIITSSSLPPIVGRTKIGESVPVVVMRNNREKTLKVIIETLPQDASKVIKTRNKPSNETVENTKQFLVIARGLPENKAIPVLVQRQQGAIFLALRLDEE
jgi:serine protease Do